MIKTRIKELREDRDLNQVYIAKILDVKQNTYSDYENEKLNLPIEALIKLASFYKTSIDFLVYQTDEKKRFPKAKHIMNDI